MRVLEWATSYGIEILSARVPTEDEQKPYADWFKKQMLVGVGDRIALTEFGWADIKTVLGDRKATHSFYGCNNFAWILEPGEEAAILAIEANRKAGKAHAETAAKHAAEERRASILATAQKTGADQVLDAYMTACDGSVSECSSDWVRVMARPDGSTYLSRTHTH